MREVKLSEVQARTLQLAVTSGSRSFYYSQGDVTLNALCRKGFAEWHNRLGRKYSKSFWWITDEGIAAGRAALSQPASEYPARAQPEKR